MSHVSGILGIIFSKRVILGCNLFTFLKIFIYISKIVVYQPTVVNRYAYIIAGFLPSRRHPERACPVQQAY
jgi:hypothetical protein